MLVVRIELWPHGDRQRSKTLAVMTISNDGTGTTDFGNYLVALGHVTDTPEHLRRGGCYKVGKVIGFMRSLSPYHLVLRALKSTLKDSETPTGG